ncbi:protein phosphatase 2C domain-containing protein [Streptomyces hypolithicus]
MSQQGDGHAAREEDQWWNRLYGDEATQESSKGVPPREVDPDPAPLDHHPHRPPTPRPQDRQPAHPPPPAPPERQRAPWEPPEVPPAPPSRCDQGRLPSPDDAPPEAWQPEVAPAPHHPPESTAGAGATAPPEAWDAAPAEPLHPAPAEAAHPTAPRPAPHASAVATPPHPAGAEPPRAGFVGGGPPTYDAEPTALPVADPRALGELAADTVLDGAQYGTYTLRAASLRGDSARFRGEPRRDALLTARFGRGDEALVLVAIAGGARAAESAHPAASEACRWIGEAVGRSHARLADDIRGARRGDLKSGLHRLTDRAYGNLRARAGELGLEPEEYTVGLRCLLLSADPRCRNRVFFGIGAGGLFRLRAGVWQDLEPLVFDPGAATAAPVVGFGSTLSASSAPSETPEGDRLTMDLGLTAPPSPYLPNVPARTDPFRFRASVARPGDTLLLCGGGLADPLRGEPALAEELAERWAPAEAPGLAEYLTDISLRVKGYADDRTAVAVWEA